MIPYSSSLVLWLSIYNTIFRVSSIRPFRKIVADQSNIPVIGKKNDIVLVKITNYSPERGGGIAKVLGCVLIYITLIYIFIICCSLDSSTSCNIDLLIPNTVIGDQIRAKVIKVKNYAAFGKIEEIIKQSKNRIIPPCLIADRCGGCQLMHQSYM